MKNKKGFTLIELLAVIAIIGIISLIAIPNIVGLSIGVRKDNMLDDKDYNKNISNIKKLISRKDNMLDDAKKLISLAKYKINSDIALRSSPPQTFTMAELNINGDITIDPDGGEYDETNSTVRYRIANGTAEYCVTLIGSKRTIGSPTCVIEAMLHSRSNVIDK